MAVRDINDTLRLGLEHHRAGRFAEAEAMYRQILTVEPNQADALHLLGVLAGQVGQRDAGIDLIRRAVAARPNFPDAYGNLGRLLAEAGRLDEAIAAYRQIVQLRPRDAVAQNTLGIALRINHQDEEASRAFSAAVQIDPKYTEAYSGLAGALKGIGQLDGAIAAYGKVIELSPGNAAAYRNVGTLLQEKGRMGEAIAAFARAVELTPADAGAHYDLGIALKDGGKMAEAMAAWSKAVQIDPMHAESYVNMGATFVLQFKWDEAKEAYRRAIELKPNLGAAHFGLGLAMNALGELDEAIACYRRAVELEPSDIDANSNMVFLLRFRPGQNLEEAFGEYLRWNERHAMQLGVDIATHTNDRDPDRRLRVGYVSPDFREHAVAWFIESPLEHHDPAAVEVFCYADLPKPDAVSERLKKLVHHWRDITALSNEEVAGKIRDDKIDILVDLAGHTEKNRLLVFARKPAPVQVSYLGYTDTTGLSAMDYRITDIHTDPPGMTERFHSEELVRLRETFAVYRPPGIAPAVAPLPALARGYVTFSSFTTLTKLNERLLECWAEILLRVRGSRMMIGAHRLHYPPRKKWLLDIFERKGIGAERLTLFDNQSLQEYLNLHDQADLMLDTFPVNGHTVICHGSWMGVPPVTLAGLNYSQRLCCSVLNNLGLTELVANSVERYIEIAVDWASDLMRLAQVRDGMRERMRGSPIMDGERFTKNLEAAYRGMWVRWCGAGR